MTCDDCLFGLCLFAWAIEGAAPLKSARDRGRILTSQLQSYEGEEVEALVIGSDGENVHLYTVDTRGISHCMNDVGFAAIGIGAWHAKSNLMQNAYVNTINFAPALAATFAAKRSADVAPGVGRHTDMWVIFRDAMIPLWTPVDTKLQEVFEQYRKDRDDLIRVAVEKLQAFINETSAASRPSDQSAGGSSSSTSEAPQIDETQALPENAD
jgi:hypothetical protein